jgi:urea-proton symporter
MAFISEIQGYILLAAFGIAMLAITLFFARRAARETMEGFLVASRHISWKLGAPSIAASWIWAPALFVSVQFAYEMGLPGLAWFLFPNMLALGLFGILAPKIRKLLPEGYTLPQWIKYRLNDERAHQIYLFPFFFYQLMAVTVQLFAGGNLVSLLTGIPLESSMVILAGIGLSYAIISGLRASIITDFIQIAAIVIGLVVVIPWIITATGGFETIANGLGGLAGNTNVFDPGVAFSFGIVTAIGLIAGALSDQQYWQRSFAIKKNDLVKSFVLGALLFGLVPLALSALGFIAASPGIEVTLPAGIDVSLIGVATVAQFLPPIALLLFVIMLLAGLSSTLDSGLCAGSTLYAIDWKKQSPRENSVLEKIRAGVSLTTQDMEIKESLDRKTVRAGRFAMLGFTATGLIVSLAVINIEGLGLQHLFWIFNTIAAAVVVPTVLSLYWNRLSAKGVVWGTSISFVVGIPIFVYGNILNDPLITVGASLFIVAVSTGFCLLFQRNTAWKPRKDRIRFKSSAN